MLKLRNYAKIGTNRMLGILQLVLLPSEFAVPAYGYSSISFHLQEQQFPRGIQAKKRDRLSQDPKISSLQQASDGEEENFPFKAWTFLKGCPLSLCKQHAPLRDATKLHRSRTILPVTC
jgi:hypothetical protein